MQVKPATTRERKLASDIYQNSVWNAGKILRGPGRWDLGIMSTRMRSWNFLKPLLGFVFFCRSKLRLAIFPPCPRDPVDSCRSAAQIYFKCRKKGISVRSTIDCLIAPITMEHDLIAVGPRKVIYEETYRLLKKSN
jgi:hypothetical protein